MRDHLHRLAEIIPAPFFGDDLFVNASCRPVVVARKFGVREAFVVAEVEVGLGAVVGDEHFPMLKG